MRVITIAYAAAKASYTIIALISKKSEISASFSQEKPLFYFLSYPKIIAFLLFICYIFKVKIFIAHFRD